MKYMSSSNVSFHIILLIVSIVKYYIPFIDWKCSRELLFIHLVGNCDLTVNAMNPV